MWFLYPDGFCLSDHCGWTGRYFSQFIFLNSAPNHNLTSLPWLYYVSYMLEDIKEFTLVRMPNIARQWWLKHVIPAFVRQRQDLCVFKASLVYRVSSQTARATRRKPVPYLKTTKTKTTKTSQAYFPLGGTGNGEIWWWQEKKNRSVQGWQWKICVVYPFCR